MDIKLTRDADALICSLYKAYLQDVKQGADIDDAKLFGSSKTIKNNIIPNWSIGRIDEACRELDRNEFLTCLYAEDTVMETVLLSDAIVYMEQRFKRGIDELLDYLVKIRSLILG